MLSDKRRESVALSASTRPVIEALEGRALFSLSFPPGSSLLDGMYRSLSVTPQAVSTPQAVGESPEVTSSRPGSGATNVLRDAHITADVRLPNSGHGVDESTLTSATVKLYRTTAGTPERAAASRRVGPAESTPPTSSSAHSVIVASNTPAT